MQLSYSPPLSLSFPCHSVSFQYAIRAGVRAYQLPHSSTLTPGQPWFCVYTVQFSSVAQLMQLMAFVAARCPLLPYPAPVPHPLAVAPVALVPATTQFSLF